MSFGQCIGYKSSTDFNVDAKKFGSVRSVQCFVECLVISTVQCFVIVYKILKLQKEIMEFLISSAVLLLFLLCSFTPSINA